MTASATDLFKKVSRKWVGQIGAGGVSDASVTTIPLSSSTNLPTGTGVEVVIDRVDSNGTKTPSLEETIVGVVSGNNIISAVRATEGTAQAHNAGAVVEVLFTADLWNDVMDGILLEHLQTGRHSDVCATSLTTTVAASQVGANITGSMILAGNMKLASGVSIMDANVNELLKFTQTASAVNEFTLTNNITGNPPIFEPTGGDSTIAGWYRGKSAFNRHTGEYSNGNSGSAITINWANGDRQLLTVTASTTLAYTSAVAGQTLTLRAIEDGTGGFSITLPTSKWPGGAAGTPTTTANAINLYIVYFDGTNYLTQLAAGFS